MIEGNLERMSFVAGQDFTSAHQHHAVNIDSTDTTDTAIAVELAGAGENAVGFLETYDTTGNDVSVIVNGQCKAVAGAAITVNAPLKVTAASRLTPCTANNDVGVAYALTAASADGEILLIQIARFYYGA